MGGREGSHEGVRLGGGNAQNKSAIPTPKTHNSITAALDMI